MPNFDKEILVKNINNLIKERGTTQSNLGKYLHLSQSSISKYLNRKPSFSIDLVFNIAQYFDVSIDELCSDSTPKPLEKDIPKTNQISVYDVCASLATIFKSNLPYIKDIIHKETACLEETEEYTNGDVNKYYSFYDKENSYTSIFFSNYEEIDYQPDPMAEYDECLELLREYGNENKKNVTVNNFLSQLVDLLGVYKKGSMTKELYIQTIDANLAKISAE